MIFEDTTYEKNDFITKEQAEFRRSIVSEVAYDVSLTLPKGEHYFGHTSAKFTLKEIPQKALCLDFRAVKLGNLKINGKAVEGENIFHDHKVRLPNAYL